MIFIAYFSICLSIAILTSSRQIKGKLCFLFICSLILAYISTFLPYTEADRRNYAYFFVVRYENLTNVFDYAIKANKDIMFEVVNVLLRKLSSRPEFFFFIVSFLSCFSALYALYQSNGVASQCCLIFVCTWYPFLTYYACRQMLAVGFFSIGFVYIVKEKYAFSVIAMLLSILFHTSAIVPITALLLIKLFINKRRLVLFSIIVVVGSFTIFPILDWMIENLDFFKEKFAGSLLSATENLSKLIWIKGTPYLLLTVVAWKNQTRLLGKACNVQILIAISLLSGMFWFYAISSYWIYRLSFYGIVPWIILLNLLYRSKDRISKNDLIIGFYGSLFMQLIISMREFIIFF